MNFPFELAMLGIGLATLVVTIGLLIVELLTMRLMKRGRQDRSGSASPAPAIYLDEEFPKIHATNGVPTFEQLIKGIEIKPEDGFRARGLYELGLERFNHYFNNRDGFIAEARREMEALANGMDQSEVGLAEHIGNGLSRADNGEERSEVEVQYDSLGPQARIYVHHKRHELQALQLIENDLRKDVPRTDYTSVKTRIESGEVALDSIMSELPVQWQDLRTINRVQYEEPAATKPPKREFINTMFLIPGSRILVDKRAERDNDWLISEEHELAVPYETLVPLMEIRYPDDPGVPTGQYVALLNRDLGTEWVTKLVRQGGYRDQQYTLARDGLSPKQIRARYRRRQLRRITQALLAVDIVLVALLLMLSWRYL